MVRSAFVSGPRVAISYPPKPNHVRADSSHAVVKAQAYGLRDTPSLVLIDMLGRLRLSHFGRMED